MSKAGKEIRPMKKGKQIRDKKGRFSVKESISVVGLAILFMGIGLGWLVLEANVWFDEHKIVTPELEVNFQGFKIEDRVTEVIQPTVLVYPEEIDDPVEKKICEAFGPYECKTALAVAKAESGMNPEAYNYNTNGTLDIGLFQVNEIHWGRPGCALTDLVTVDGSIACALELQQEQGWDIWVAVQNGSFGRHL